MSDLKLWDPLLSAPFFKELGSRLGKEGGPLCVTGLTAGARALVLSLLASARGCRMVVVAPDDAAIEAYRRDLSALAALVGLDSARIVVLPALDADPYDDIPPHPEVVRERVVAIERLRSGEVDLLLLPARALLQPLPAPDDWASWTRTVRDGDNLPPERFVLQALGLGYRRVDTVSSPGEISRRGGIIDVFAPTASEPVRIELFGDTVESIRSFDTDNQRPTGMLDETRCGVLRVTSSPAATRPAKAPPANSARVSTSSRKKATGPDSKHWRS